MYVLWKVLLIFQRYSTAEYTVHYSLCTVHYSLAVQCIVQYISLQLLFLLPGWQFPFLVFADVAWTWSLGSGFLVALSPPPAPVVWFSWCCWKILALDTVLWPYVSSFWPVVDSSCGMDVPLDKVMGCFHS